ncbi:RB1-inducible coiled-coil protein 1 isoform X2 [Latimeria chalumnae]|uniref:RB1-inducible coiled-coil protein 1 isoform X2 n=1 Tax=Latimeria chalumnae TaxID=7897 RepID=UPI00313E5D38
MKLYVFMVNTGTTLTFDTELAVQTVADLKHAIQAKYKISIQHQVLVVNGGECMAAERRVCSYSAGTDTNPIFLFNKDLILSDRPPTIPKTTFSAENEMQLKVEESLMMPAVFHTVASRTQLAVEMYEVAKKLCSFCERLVHDEHLQHQGWAAIMANLDDCTHSYQKLLFKFDSAYSSYLQSIDDIKVKLTNLGTSVSVMAKIPLLECLTRHSYRESVEKLSSSATNGVTEGEETEDEKSTESVLYPGEPKISSNLSSASISISVEQAARDSGKPEDHQENSDTKESTAFQECQIPGELKNGNQHSFNVSLLDWINVQDRPNDVESLVRKCFDSMSRLDPRIIQPFLAECRETIAKLDNQNMKAIKGLEDRLYALDQMIASCNRLVNEQKELAQGFLANQKRAENLKDPSVLPDLCLSHANQLMIMLTNHKKLLDFKQKCTTAKQELANNLQVRLKWCCYVMLHADQDGEKLQALLRLLTELLERVRIVEALSTVPQVYCLAVVEVVRRKMFVKHYREWASALVKDGKQLYETERAKRESFGKLFRKSFLRNRLFRDIDSWPPSSFCTQKPRTFDSELPDISLAELQFLQSCCPLEVQPFLRVPILCDFEPLHQHVQILHNLVKAAQSLDEMSQTVTDLLNEQKLQASNGQATLQSTTALRSESTTGITATTSSKTPPSLSLQGTLCPPISIPGPLEELSPDSIDAHTFDFETIPHSSIDQALKQGSLDLDLLAESPESDFMSAVNEFVIEENPTSPNLISDPQSPEMMVESLYSSVINAIDNRRMQDTNTCEKQDLMEATTLKACIEKYKAIAQESQSNLKNFKEDLCHFRVLVQKEQHDYASSLHFISVELRNIFVKIKHSLEENLDELHQKDLQILRQNYEDKVQKLMNDAKENQEMIDKLKADLQELEEALINKGNELSLVKNEKEMVIYSQVEKDQQLHNLEKMIKDQETEIQELRQSREVVLEDLQQLHINTSDKMEELRTELQILEQNHLRELENSLQARHKLELEKIKTDHRDQLEKIKKENQVILEEIQESHRISIREKEHQLDQLSFKVSELSDLRCRLEVEMALKETETEEIRMLLEQNKSQQEETVRFLVEKETEILSKQLSELKHQVQLKNDEHELGLADLRTLMTLEKDQCIRELVDRHEEESSLLRAELHKLNAVHQQDLEGLQTKIREFDCKEREQATALENLKEEKQNALYDQEEKYKSLICQLQEENKQLLNIKEQERILLMQTLNDEKKEVIQVAQRDFEKQKETLEKELLEKVQQLERKLTERESKEREAGLTTSAEPLTGDSPGSISDLQERFQEEKVKLLEKLELLEKRKNDELQNLKTSLIAEQQTNFNTVLTREKLKKEHIINELHEKLKKMTQQQERDKDLIETLSEDRACLLHEKKKLEEEINKLRSVNLVSSAYLPTTSVSGAEVSAACAVDLAGETERLVSVATTVEEGRADSAMDASMMAVRESIPVLSEEKQRIMLLERTLQMKEEENKRLNQRLMSQSMSSVSSRHSEKIAIREPNPILSAFRVFGCIGSQTSFRFFKKAMGAWKSNGKRILSGKEGSKQIQGSFGYEILQSQSSTLE